MENQKKRFSPALLVAIGFGLLAVFGSVKAYQSYTTLPPKVVVEGNYIEAASSQQNQPVVQVARDEGALGATNISDVVSPYICVNNVCTYSIVQTFIDASTTIVSIPDPFLMATSTGDTTSVVLKTDDGGQAYTGATTTVDTVRLNITGAATTSYAVACGASAGPVPAQPFASQGTVIVTTTAYAVPTSTIGVIENNVSASQGAFVTGGTVAKVMLGPGLPYLTCLVNPTAAAGFTNAQNTFDGKATVNFRRTR